MKTLLPAAIFGFALALGALSLSGQVVQLSPRLSALGQSQRYLPATRARALSASEVDGAFLDVIATHYLGKQGAAAGADAVMYFRLGGRIFPHPALKRLQRTFTGQTIGRYAERRLMITDGWRLVANPRAPQNDLYKFVNGKLIGAQVKAYSSGSPQSYLDAMRGDNKAEIFYVPDDHYATLTEHIQEKLSAAKAADNTREVEFLETQLKRATKMGATYDQLQSEAKVAVKLARGRLIAARLGWVVTGVLVLPSACVHLQSWYVGDIPGNEAAFRVASDLATLGAGAGGALAGQYLFKANPWASGGLAAGAVFLMQEALVMQHYGGFKEAFSEPAFWVVTGGNVGAGVLATAGGYYGAQGGMILGSPGGPIGVGIGAAVGGLLGAGTGAVIGTFGGQKATALFLELVFPEFVFAERTKAIENEMQRLRACAASQPR